MKGRGWSAEEGSSPPGGGSPGPVARGGWRGAEGEGRGAGGEREWAGDVPEGAERHVRALRRKMEQIEDLEVRGGVVGECWGEGGVRSVAGKVSSW